MGHFVLILRTVFGAGPFRRGPLVCGFALFEDVAGGIEHREELRALILLEVDRDAGPAGGDLTHGHTVLRQADRQRPGLDLGGQLLIVPADAADLAARGKSGQAQRLLITDPLPDPRHLPHLREADLAGGQALVHFRHFSQRCHHPDVFACGVHAHRGHMHDPFGQGLHPDPLRPQPASLRLVDEGDDPGVAEGDARDVAADIGDDLLTAEPAEIGLGLSAAAVVRVDAQRFDLPSLRRVEFRRASRFLAPHGAPPLGPPVRQPPWPPTVPSL